MQLDVAGFKNPVLVRNGMGERVGAVCMSDRQHHHDHPGLFLLVACLLRVCGHQTFAFSKGTTQRAVTGLH